MFEGSVDCGRCAEWMVGVWIAVDSRRWMSGVLWVTPQADGFSREEKNLGLETITRC